MRNETKIKIQQDSNHNDFFFSHFPQKQFQYGYDYIMNYLNLPQNLNLEQVIQEFVHNKKNIQKEKIMFTPQKILIKLEQKQWSDLQLQFQKQYSKGIDLINFLKIMLAVIRYQESEFYMLLHSLTKLFQDIDFQGKNKIFWEQFTNYMCEDAIKYQNNAQYNSIQPTQKQILDLAYSRRNKHFNPSQKQDQTYHNNVIKKSIGYKSYILILEQEGTQIKTYNIYCKQLQNMRISLQFKNLHFMNDLKLKSSKIFIIDFSLNEANLVIGCILSNRNFIFYLWGHTPKLLCYFLFEMLNTKFEYLPIHKLWATAGIDFDLRLWQFENKFFQEYKQTEILDYDSHVQKMKKLKDKVDSRLKIQFKAHVNLITAIIQLYSPKLVATGSLDGVIKLWEIETETLLTILHNSDEKAGIKGLDYSYPFGSYMISYGFKNYINVWCPEMSVTRSFIGRLQGHFSLIQICKFLKGTPYCISIDDKLYIRIWDIRTMIAIQVLTKGLRKEVGYNQNEKKSYEITKKQGMSSVNDMAILPQQDKFVIVSKRIIVYDNEMANTIEKTFNQDVFPIDMVYNQFYNKLFILTKIDVRGYSMVNGKLLLVIRNNLDCNGHQFTSISLCNKQRNIIVADVKGCLSFISSKNGKLLNRIRPVNFYKQIQLGYQQKQNTAIIKTIYLPKQKNVISVGDDQFLYVMEQKEPIDLKLLKVITGVHKSPITALLYSQTFSIILTGELNGIVVIWDYQTGSFIHMFEIYEQKIVSFLIMDDYEVLLICTSKGNVYLFRLSSSEQFKSIVKIKNFNIRNGEIEYFGVNAICMYELQRQLLEREVKDRKYFPWKLSKEKKVKKLNLIDSQQFIQLNELIFKEKSKQYVYLFLATATGQIKAWNLTPILLHFNIKKDVKPLKKFQLKDYSLKRRDYINVSKQFQIFLQNWEPTKTYTTLIDIEGITRIMWSAHKASIYQIIKFMEHNLLISCSFDKYVKIWSLEGNLICQFNLVRFEQTYWNLEVDLVQRRFKQLEIIFPLINEIKQCVLTKEQKERILAYFMKNLYKSQKKQVKSEQMVYQEIMEKVAKKVQILNNMTNKGVFIKKKSIIVLSYQEMKGSSNIIINQNNRSSSDNRFIKKERKKKKEIKEGQEKEKEKIVYKTKDQIEREIEMVQNKYIQNIQQYHLDMLQVDKSNLYWKIQQLQRKANQKQLENKTKKQVNSLICHQPKKYHPPKKEKKQFHHDKIPEPIIMIQNLSKSTKEKMMKEMVINFQKMKFQKSNRKTLKLKKSRPMKSAESLLNNQIYKYSLAKASDITKYSNNQRLYNFSQQKCRPFQYLDRIKSAMHINYTNTSLQLNKK